MSANETAPDNQTSSEAIHSTRSAEDVNAEMVAAGKTPCWKPGTTVVEKTVPAGSQYNIAVENAQAQNLAEGGTWFGDFASQDPIPSQSYAENNLAIKVPEWKPDISQVATVQTTGPQLVRTGIAGPVDNLPGGASQVQFSNPSSTYFPGSKTCL